MASRRSDSLDDSGIDAEKFTHLRHGPSIDITQQKKNTFHHTDENVTALPNTGFPFSVPYHSVQPAAHQTAPPPPTRRPLVARIKTEYILLSKKKKIGILVGIVALLVLIIGLAAGLSTRSHRSQNLPLPNNHGGPYTGDLTYYAPALGSCGVTSSSSDSIVAVSHLLYDAVSTGSNPNANPLCGKKIRARRNGKSVDLTVVDRCTGCKATDLDVTESVFAQLAEIDEGRVTVEWAWLEDVPGGVIPSSTSSSSVISVTTSASTTIASSTTTPATTPSSSTTLPVATTTSSPPPSTTTTLTTTPAPTPETTVSSTTAPAASAPTSEVAPTDSPATSVPAATESTSAAGESAGNTTTNTPAPSSSA